MPEQIVVYAEGLSWASNYSHRFNRRTKYQQTISGNIPNWSSPILIDSMSIFVPVLQTDVKTTKGGTRYDDDFKALAVALVIEQKLAISHQRRTLQRHWYQHLICGSTNLMWSRSIVCGSVSLQSYRVATARSKLWPSRISVHDEFSGSPSRTWCKHARYCTRWVKHVGVASNCPLNWWSSIPIAEASTMQMHSGLNR